MILAFLKVKSNTEDNMGVFSRLGDIINSNINAMLDKAEDPEKMIRLMIQEMEDTLVDLKSSCAAKMTTRAEMERDRNEFTEKIERWGTRAILAVEKKRDDLAKEALLEKKQHQTQLEFVQKDLENYNRLIEECKINISQLESKLDEVIMRHKMLIQRGIHAVEKKKARNLVSNATGARAMMRFGELENRIERIEADADLAGSTNDLEKQFNRLESDGIVEKELEALKKNLDTARKPTTSKSQSVGKDA